MNIIHIFKGQPGCEAQHAETVQKAPEIYIKLGFPPRDVKHIAAGGFVIYLKGKRSARWKGRQKSRPGARKNHITVYVRCVCAHGRSS